MNPIQGIDFGTYYWFRNLRNTAAFDLSPVMQFLSRLGDHTVVATLTLACLALLLVRRRFRAAGVIIGIVTCAVLMGEGLKMIVRRPRPADAEIWLGKAGLLDSFPSTSALLSSLVLFLFALILTGTLTRRRTRLLAQGGCLLLALLIGTSQMFLGLHFLTDVIAGWTAGVLLAVVADYVTPFSRESPASADGRH
jgi:undecaprenyl-diphosphatase